MRFILFTSVCSLLPCIGFFAWLSLVSWADGELPHGTMVRATLWSILIYIALLPVWYGMAWLMDAIVKG